MTALRPWYYFRLCFSLSCSGYDLIVIKNSHTLNWYSFSQKFLLETQISRLVVGDCGGSIYNERQIRKKLSTFCHLSLIQEIIIATPHLREFPQKNFFENVCAHFRNSHLPFEFSGPSTTCVEFLFCISLISVTSCQYRCDF